MKTRQSIVGILVLFLLGVIGPVETMTVVAREDGTTQLFLPIVRTNVMPHTSYHPIGELLPPNHDEYTTRAVEEKDGFAYLLEREGAFHTYDLRELSDQGFVSYDLPLSSQQLANGNGLMRNGDYIYAFGESGIEIISVANPSDPRVVDALNEIAVNALTLHHNYLIAVGHNKLVVYSVTSPSNLEFVSQYSAPDDRWAFSVAVYEDTLYVGEFEHAAGHDSQSSSLRIIDFSEPTNLSMINIVQTVGELPYHLRVYGNHLVACGTTYVHLWNLDNPDAPAFVSRRQAHSRVCALDGDRIVTNGAVLRANGNLLEEVDTFNPVGWQIDGFPYGSAVTSEFVYLAQSQRVLILHADSD